MVVFRRSRRARVFCTPIPLAAEYSTRRFQHASELMPKKPFESSVFVAVMILDRNSRACFHKAMPKKAERKTTAHEVMHALRHNT